MCTQKPPNNWSEPLYNNYCEAVHDYLTERILPRIKDKHDESMLRVQAPGTDGSSPSRSACGASIAIKHNRRA